MGWPSGRAGLLSTLNTHRAVLAGSGLVWSDLQTTCILLFNKLPHTEQLKITIFIVSHNFKGSPYLGGSGSGSFMRLQLGSWLGLQSSQGLTGPGGFASQMAPSCGCW